MITRSRIISDASGYCGEPPDEPLPIGVPEWMRYTIAADLEIELLRDLNLSAENRTLTSYQVRLQPGRREFIVSRPDLENATYVQVAFGDNANPVNVDISNLTLLTGIENDGRRAVAFYDDNPQRAKVSWNPSGSETLTIWFDRSPNIDPSPEQATFTLTTSYIPHLKLLLAGQMIELMGKKLSDYPMLMSRISRGMEQWKKFVKSGRQQGVVQKTPWRPGRYPSGNTPAPFWPNGIEFE